MRSILRILSLGLLALCAGSAFAAQFTLSWADNSSNEQGFIIERAPGLAPAASAFVAVGLVGADVKTFVDPGLPPSMPFAYRVCAYNAAGKSGYSNTVSGTTSTIPAGLTPPSAPTGGTLQGDTPFVPPVIAVNASLQIQGDKILSATVAAAPAP